MKILTFAKTITKSMVRKPATRLYPFEKRQPFSITRGSIVIDTAKCTLCLLCMRRCPTQAIEVKKPERTWAIDRLRCCQCNRCVEVCPTDALSMVPAYSPAQTDRHIDTFNIPLQQKQAAAPEPAQA